MFCVHVQLPCVHLERHSSRTAAETCSQICNLYLKCMCESVGSLVPQSVCTLVWPPLPAASASCGDSSSSSTTAAVCGCCADFQNKVGVIVGGVNLSSLPVCVCVWRSFVWGYNTCMRLLALYTKSGSDIRPGRQTDRQTVQTQQSRKRTLANRHHTPQQQIQAATAFDHQTCKVTLSLSLYVLLGGGGGGGSSLCVVLNMLARMR